MDKLTAEACTRESLRGSLPFPIVVERLGRAGVETYYADLLQMRKTYYAPCGETHEVAMDYTAEGLPPRALDKEAVQAAIRSSQRREIAYTEFLRRAMAAGTVGYFVFLAGRRAVYFGRDGETHVERLPTQ